VSDFTVAVVLSLAAAVVFATGAQLTRLGLRSTDAQSGALVSIGTATLLHWCLAPWLLEASYWESSAVWLFVLVGLFRPFLSSTFAMAGTAMLGPTITTTLASTGPLFGLVFGVMILGEAFTVPVAIGTFATVGGVALLAYRSGHDPARNWPLWALGLPVAAAFIRISAHLITKVGMEEVPSAYFAGLVAFTASFAMGLINAGRRRRNPITILRTRGAWWFVVIGFLFGFAMWAVNAALRFGPLSVVAPLVSLEAVVVAILGALVFREHEITRRTLVAVAMVVVGAVLITSQTE
jgi:DME family drug/metabolite transporter